MASQSTLKSFRAGSIVLLLIAAGLIVSGAVKVGHHYILSGAELIGWGLLTLAFLLGFVYPVRCRVKRTNRKACGNWSYGLLLGCGKTAGHRWGKLLVRMRLNHGETKPVQRRPPPEGTVVFNQPASQSKQQPVSVTVEEGFLSKCGFWVGLASGVIGITQAVVTFVH